MVLNIDEYFYAKKTHVSQKKAEVKTRGL